MKFTLPALLALIGTASAFPKNCEIVGFSENRNLISNCKVYDSPDAYHEVAQSLDLNECVGLDKKGKLIWEKKGYFVQDLKKIGCKSSDVKYDAKTEALVLACSGVTKSSLKLTDRFVGSKEGFVSCKF